MLQLPSPEEELDRHYVHWGATAEVMEIIRRREKSPETKKLVERLLEITGPGKMRRRYGQNELKNNLSPVETK